MLKNYYRLPQKLENYFKEIIHWPEITFNKEDKEKLKQISNVSNVNDHSIQLTIDGGNHTILPSQYLLYAVFVKEFALDVKEYIDVFELKKRNFSQNEIGQSIISNNLNYDELDIDNYSKIIGPKIFTDANLNLGSKSIVNGNEGNYKLRGSVDFYGSIILKPINIPNASSSILGKFIYNLTEKKDIYDYFERRFLNKLKFIVKEKVLKNFCFDVVSFLYNYDALEGIIPFIVKNNDNNFSSIKHDNFNLTTIFKTATNVLSDDELTQGGALRFFNYPIFYLNNEYYYFSTEWTNNGNGRLDLQSLIALINTYYPEFSISIENDTFIFKSKSKEMVLSLKGSKNTIYYGAPGTGKSHKVDKIIEELETKYYERVTFHPEYDNSSFIGGYKPISVKERYEDEDGEYFENEVHYKFVPQAFTNIYERAWQDLDNQYYLVIEEINRGNCAEIFGEIFQLLDRTSKYTVSPTKELKEYLISEAFKDDKHSGIVNGLKLPPNLSILATMNTSDQSLFPMDSAFKRRWDWEYIPICYNPIDDFKQKNDSFDFEIDIADGKKYSWIKFIEKINLNHIKVNPSLGMDKCIGNYFIKPDNGNVISLKPFVNKVIFYLWNDVFKDEDNKVFEDNTSYEDFFPIDTNGKKKIKELFDRIDLKAIPSLEIVEDENPLGQVAESPEEMES
jgi:hypothetical protein